MKIVVLILQVLLKVFGQNALFAAFKEVAKRKTKIKLMIFDEKEEIREIKNEIKETKLRNKLEKLKVKISKKGIERIKKHEGLRLKAYDDLQPHVEDPEVIKGTLTIGYGHIKDVKAGDVITEAEAEEYLKEDLEWSEKAVNDLFEEKGWNKYQNRYDALVSWVYNTGTKSLPNRNLIRAIDAYDKAEKKIDEIWNKHYVTSKGVKLTGLVNRRKEELDLFLNRN